MLIKKYRMMFFFSIEIVFSGACSDIPPLGLRLRACYVYLKCAFFLEKRLINLPGQGFAEHSLYSTDSPRLLQFFPPYFACGLLHSRDHLSSPSPHVTLHVLFNDQLP
jgi:hypothetical protein